MALPLFLVDHNEKRPDYKQSFKLFLNWKERNEDCKENCFMNQMLIVLSFFFHCFCRFLFAEEG